MATTLYIRGLDEDILFRFNRAARVRGLTQSQYLEKLVELHEYARLHASGTGDIRATIAALGLGPVTT